MSSSTPSPRFLLDENVRGELDGLLSARGYDVSRLPKGAQDGELAKTSMAEERILVTNDADFRVLHPTALYSVVWLRIPQRDAGSLVAAFGRLLDECADWRGQMVELAPDSWSVFPLGETEGQ